jgi:hypothetical protein
MTEKYIVIDTYFKDRFIAVKYLGETERFINVEAEYGAPRRRSRDTVIIASTHGSMDDAEKAAAQLTAKLKGARRHYNQRVTEIFADAQANAGGE